MSNEYDSRTTSGETFKLPSWLVVLVIAGMFGFAWWQNHHPSLPTESAATTRSQSSGNLPNEDEPAIAEVTPERDRDFDRRTSNFPTDRNEPGSSTDDPTTDERTNPESHPARSNTPGPLSGLRHKSTEESRSSSPRIFDSDRRRPTEKSQEAPYEVENQTIRDLYGKVVYRGTIDLTPTLERIERGESNRHRNDGTSFQNREGRLPRKPAGYYKEYVQPTPGEHGPGPQRVIIGEQGEVWYTPDHYKSFRKIK